MKCFPRNPHMSVGEETRQISQTKDHQKRQERSNGANLSREKPTLTRAKRQKLTSGLQFFTSISACSGEAQRLDLALIGKARIRNKDGIPILRPDGRPFWDVQPTRMRANRPLYRWTTFRKDMRKQYALLCIWLNRAMQPNIPNVSIMETRKCIAQ